MLRYKLNTCNKKNDKNNPNLIHVQHLVAKKQKREEAPPVKCHRETPLGSQIRWFLLASTIESIIAPKTILINLSPNKIEATWPNHFSHRRKTWIELQKIRKKIHCLKTLFDSSKLFEMKSPTRFFPNRKLYSIAIINGPIRKKRDLHPDKENQ